MGLLDARNINKAKGLLEKNRHKVGSIVGKATDQVDKLSKGKTSAVTAKIDKAAMKFSHPGTASHDSDEQAATAEERPEHPDTPEASDASEHADDSESPDSPATSG